MKKLFLLVGLVVFLTPMLVSANPNIVFCLTSSGNYYTDESFPQWGKDSAKCLSGNEITFEKYIKLNPSFIGSKTYKRHFEQNKEEITLNKNTEKKLFVNDEIASEIMLVKMDRKQFNENCKSWMVATFQDGERAYNERWKKYDGYYKAIIKSNITGRKIKEICVSNHKIKTQSIKEFMPDIGMRNSKIIKIRNDGMIGKKKYDLGIIEGSFIIINNYSYRIKVWNEERTLRDILRKTQTSSKRPKIILSKYDEFAIALGCGIKRKDVDDCVRRYLPATIGSGPLTMEQINEVKKDEELMGEIVLAISLMKRAQDESHGPTEEEQRQAQEQEQAQAKAQGQGQAQQTEGHYKEQSDGQYVWVDTRSGYEKFTDNFCVGCNATQVYMINRATKRYYQGAPLSGWDKFVLRGGNSRRVIKFYK